MVPGAEFRSLVCCHHRFRKLKTNPWWRDDDRLSVLEMTCSNDTIHVSKDPRRSCRHPSNVLLRATIYSENLLKREHEERDPSSNRFANGLTAHLRNFLAAPLFSNVLLKVAFHGTTQKYPDTIGIK